MRSGEIISTAFGSYATGAIAMWLRWRKSTPGTLPTASIIRAIAGPFGSNFGPHSYRKRSSVAKKIESEPARTFVSTSFRLCGSGSE